MTTSKLYRFFDQHPKLRETVWNTLVYRHVRSVDLSKAPLEDWAWAHKQCAFICESDAQDYCDYRNEMFEKYGNDAIESIKRVNGRICDA